MLGDPQKNIIDNGGYIFFSKAGDEIAGTFALMKVNDDVYELGKMAVDEKHQGKKIGNAMLEFCIKKAKELGAAKVQLYSNTMLGPAIHLYEKVGFEKEGVLRKYTYLKSEDRFLDEVLMSYLY